MIDSAAGFGLQVNNASAVNGSAALYGKQGAGSSVTNDYGSAVLGDAESGVGVLGLSKTENGVLGFSDANSAVSGISASWHGVAGRTHSNTAAGVYASGSSSSGIALKIAQGGITIEGAGESTATPVFVHKVVTGGAGNLCAIQPYASVIDHPLTNGCSDTILIVRPNYGANDTGVAPAPGGYAVYYDATDQCGKGAGKWVIYNLDATALTNNSRVNVLVVNP